MVARELSCGVDELGKWSGVSGSARRKVESECSGPNALRYLTPAFDKERAVAAHSKGIGRGPSSNDSDSDYPDHSNLWEEEDLYVSSVESARYDVSKLEAHLYYFGIRGPKLIFRTSKSSRRQSTIIVSCGFGQLRAPQTWKGRSVG